MCDDVLFKYEMETSKGLVEIINNQLYIERNQNSL